MTTFVLIHGAWHGGWCWQRVTPLLEDAGHRVESPTLSGLGDRVHLLSHRVNLSTHINDIERHVRDLGLRDITLVGHSYGGFPVTAAAHRLGALVSHLVLLDAFLPVSGEMLLDHAPALIAQYRAAADADKNWHIPPIPSAAFGVEETDQAWVDAQLTAQPVESYFEPIAFSKPLLAARKTYIRCTQAPGNLLETSIRRVQSDREWRFVEVDAGHDIMISDPALLAQALLDQSSFS